MSDRWTVTNEEHQRIGAAMTDPLVQFPDWERTTRVHDWRNYVSAPLAAAWPTLSPWLRAAIWLGCEDRADMENWD